MVNVDDRNNIYKENIVKILVFGFLFDGHVIFGKFKKNQQV